MFRSSEGDKHGNDVMLSLQKLQRNPSLQEIQDLYKLTVEEKHSRLENASRIAQLEQR